MNVLVEVTASVVVGAVPRCQSYLGTLARDSASTRALFEKLTQAELQSSSAV